MPPKHIAIIGAGMSGIATAYYLYQRYPQKVKVTLIDAGQPMAFTSAQSGENYRNWWPHPDMVAFINHSIDLMEQIALDSANRIHMSRRGYVLASRRENIDDWIQQLYQGQTDNTATNDIRFHTDRHASAYQAPLSADWQKAPEGVDILQNPELIKATFPHYDPTINNIIHIRRAGDISGQQMGLYMLEHGRALGLQHLQATVKNIAHNSHYTLSLENAEQSLTLESDYLVNAAGPFIDHIASMLDVTLPVFNTLQQKIAFPDHKQAIPRHMPFSVDMDEQTLDWQTEESVALAEDPETRWLTEAMPGAIHCRPDGGEQGQWIKMGWAYNQQAASAEWEPALSDVFPEIVLRGAARLNPALKAYYNYLPQQRTHYGGWYTMTEENWPLIGPMGPAGSFMNGALSGFGTMAACAAGELCAQWLMEDTLPAYAQALSLQRYRDTALMQTLKSANKGVL